MEKNTVTFMSAKFPVSFSVDSDVAENLVKSASTNKAKSEPASDYVNRMLKWALANYKENTNAAEENPAK